MKMTLKLMRVGMNMQEATIVEWFVEPGGRFAAGDKLYAFETDKVSQEFEASAAGTMIEIHVPAGTEAAVGDPLCSIEVDG